MAESFLQDFVLGHDPSDVLRELIQNEFDAQGSALEIVFGPSSLTIVGYGNPIDDKGWKRLSVMLGTGKIAGDETLGEVQPKENGIGSKNLGLRSLFLFGDRIYLRSAGLQTVLDVTEGALACPIPEPASHGRRGVQIEVPYRSVATGKLEPFSTQREQAALDGYLSALAPLMIKLARPGARKDLRRLRVSSERCGRALMWSQSARKVPTRERRLSIVQRSVVLNEYNGAERSVRQGLQEIEFQTTAQIPREHSGRSFPGYFRLPGGRVLLSISVRLRRGKPDFSVPGTFYYPIGVRHGFTGTALSVCAPFEMSEDRTALQPTSSWNDWLLREAADFTCRLLVGDWISRFKADAYMALRKQFQPADERYADRLEHALRTESCWVTRQTEGGSHRQRHFAKLDEIVVPDTRELGKALSDARYLADDIATESVGKMAISLGGRRFSANSLIRLRCAGKEEKHLVTKMKDGEANYHFPAFPSSIRSVETQVQMAVGLDSVWTKLSTENRRDLSTTATTLAADATLKPLVSLQLVSEELSDAPVVPDSQRLHPALTPFRISKLAQPFAVQKWVRDVALRSRQDAASDEERQALYRFVLRKHGGFDAPTTGVIRNSPVLLDHLARWVRPAVIMLRGVPHTAQTQQVLSFPHTDYARDRGLARALGFRRKLDGADLAAYASYVAEHPEVAEAFEELLEQVPHLLLRPTLEKLKRIPFLRSSRSELVEPTRLYIRTPQTEACLGSNVPYAAGERSNLYRKLGCRAFPLSTDIIGYLRELRLAGTGPTQLDVLYPRLVEALRAENKPQSLTVDEPILWDGRNFSSPAESLIGSQFQATFLAAVPCMVSLRPMVRHAFVSLGAQTKPQPRHWERLLAWIAQQHGETKSPIPQNVRRALRAAYMATPVPESLGSDVKFLLDREGKLHAPAEASADRYVIDDDPAMARLIADAGFPVAFADDLDPKTREFIIQAGTKRLTEVRRPAGLFVGEPRLAPSWFEPTAILQRIHSSDIVSAIETLVFQLHPVAHDRPSRRLAAIDELAIVERIDARFRIGRFAIDVPRRFAVEGHRVVIVRPVSRLDGAGLVAQAIAGLYIERDTDRGTLADAIYRVLECRTTQDIQVYLESRGIPWQPLSGTVTDEIVDEVSDAGLENESESQADALAKLISSDLRTRPPETPPVESTGAGSNSPTSTPQREVTRPQLPPIESVIPEELAPDSDWEPSPVKSTGGGGSAYWRPRTADEQEQDAGLGRRGEEIVIRQELERMKRLGQDASRVIWTARSNPNADHDIRSVADDGGELWIEVKATVGEDGRFDWPRAEYEKAMIERGRYVLCRVYKADSEHPIIKRFTDPIGLLLAHKIRLSLSTLAAEVEPLN